MCPHSCASNTECTEPRAHTQPINCNIIPQKDTMIPYMAQTSYPSNSQVLTKLFPSATIPAILHYAEFTDKYSPQYGRLLFSFYFMTSILFSTSLPPLPTPLLITQPIQSTTQPPSLLTITLPFSCHSPHFPSL